MMVIASIQQVSMENTVKRCRIWIPQWRVDDLEAWFKDMSSQGWELANIDGKTAVFHKSEPLHSYFYCHIRMPEKDRKEPNEDSDEIEQQATMSGWERVAVYDNVQIFKSNTIRSYPASPENEIDRIITLYKRTSGKISIPGTLIGLSAMGIAKGLFEPLTFLTMSGGLYEVFALLVALISFIALLIIRSFTISNIKSKYETVMPHRQVYDRSYQNAAVRIAAGYWLKKMIYAACAVVLFYPLAAMGMDYLIKGDHHPIPEGELPVIRLNDIRQQTVESLGNRNGTENTYETIPGILLPEQVLLYESFESQWISSKKYTAIWIWYADLISMGARKQALGDLIEYENQEKFGFDKIWYNPNTNAIHVIVAQKDKTVYYVVCLYDDVADEEILGAMQTKLKVG